MVVSPADSLPHLPLPFGLAKGCPAKILAPGAEQSEGLARSSAGGPWASKDRAKSASMRKSFSRRPIRGLTWWRSPGPWWWMVT